jgi:hypothetical protein
MDDIMLRDASPLQVKTICCLEASSGQKQSWHGSKVLSLAVGVVRHGLKLQPLHNTLINYNCKEL